MIKRSFYDFLIAILIIYTPTVGKRENNFFALLQAHVYGNERCAEDQQQDSDFDDAGRVSGRSEDPRRVSEPGAQQINGQLTSWCHYRRPPWDH